MLDCLCKVCGLKTAKNDSARQNPIADHKTSVYKLSLPTLKQAVKSIKKDTQSTSPHNYNKLTGLSLCDILGEDNFNSIIAYPESDVCELLSIMTNLQIECIPVVKNPWDKRLVGVIHLKNLKALMQ